MHKRNSAYSTTSAEHNKEKAFTNGKYLIDTTNDASQCILCTTTKLNNIINIKCDL